MTKCHVTPDQRLEELEYCYAEAVMERDRAATDAYAAELRVTGANARVGNARKALQDMLKARVDGQLTKLGHKRGISDGFGI